MGNVSYLLNTYCTADGLQAFQQGGYSAISLGYCASGRTYARIPKVRVEEPDSAEALAPTCGPILGAPLGDQQYWVWARGRYAQYKDKLLSCTLVVQLLDKNDEGSGRVFSCPMSEDTDFCAAVKIQVPDGKPMSYRCGYVEHDSEDVLNLEAIKWSKAVTCKGTLRSKPPIVSVVFGSCKWVGKDALREPILADKADVVYKTINAQIDQGVATDAFLSVGDNIYADDFNVFDPDDTLDEFCYNYRTSFSTEGQQRLMSRMPTFMQADDHDFWNNFARDAKFRKGFNMSTIDEGQQAIVEQFQAAFGAYKIYQKMHSPSANLPKQHWYTSKVSGLDVFVIDVRLERRNDVSPKIMMGAAQLAALKTWLKDLGDAVKCIVTAVPFLPEMGTPDPEPYGSDTWNGYPEQRDEIFLFIKENQVPNVVFLSGDLHCGFSCAVDCGGLQVLQFVASPLYYPFGKAGANVLPLKVGDTYTTLKDGTAVKLTHMSQLIEEDLFGRLTVDMTGTARSIHFQIFARELEAGKPRELLSSKFPVEGAAIKSVEKSHFPVLLSPSVSFEDKKMESESATFSSSCPREASQHESKFVDILRDP
mmetsp:Transcript_43904/g.78887  ORF Transcript_43904/g.78887 Transcript_43904/m.78887 type:complete len:591 (-) Transcript_43904:323-2095(-)|eukprot:CAMPEP_0197625382 /NCGR_PEP_ID=MMETSP1338-20131121/4762_1 /TAXON_ID=43686 ORGANISM="Pelagodinium beii, Strain RCC1491" /NCGR_SAMPLE_ID=MMETSP1338 /ASSEMBLY_ACC=CAM_ASM_000754 /LENGTH=590 /DNA_ID=CAMNT_0043195777 /DNA_START=62 /DNA_END=1834 /DNA_ORIENTATION=+